MNRFSLAVGIVAIAIGAVGGWLGSGLWSDHAQRQVSESRFANLERQVDDLRKENARMGAQLKTAQGRIETTEADLKREQEMNARLHLLVSAGRK